MRGLLVCRPSGAFVSSSAHRVFCPHPPALPLLMFCIDLILILWPIFFVAATNQGPHLKPREFKTYVAGVTQFVGATASVEGPRKNGPRKNATTYFGQSERPADRTEQAVEQAPWETTSPGIYSAQRHVRVCRNQRRRAWIVPPRIVLPIGATSHY